MHLRPTDIVSREIKNPRRDIWILLAICGLTRLLMLPWNTAEYTDGVLQVRTLVDPVGIWPPLYSTLVYILKFVFGFLWSVFVVAYLNGSGVFRWLLATRPLRYIGVVSFSVYLWHLPILVLVGNHWRSDPAFVALAVIALALLFSGISYLLIERPFIRSRLARRLISLPALWGQPR